MATRGGEVDARAIEESRAAFAGESAKSAPGRPGAVPRWAPGAKDGVGTSLAGSSLTWFTIGQGILNEVFHPRIDHACIRDLGLVVADGDEFVSEERIDAETEVAYPHEGVPLYRVVNTCRQGRYRIEKTILAHPEQDAVLQYTRFVPLAGTLDDYQVYALLNPMLGPWGEFSPDDAWLADHRGVPMLFAKGPDRAVALACSPDWIAGSAGFVGESDGWQDLSRHKRLTKVYGKAERGNVALTGRVDLSAGDGRFTLALGLGPDPEEAGLHALAGLLDDAGTLQEGYVRAWRGWQATVDPAQAPAGGRDLSRVSTFVLKTHAARANPGAMDASLATPWGAAQGRETVLAQRGYHLVWARDLVESAGGLLAAGDARDPMRTLGYLRSTQSTDGHWPQNQWVSGKPHEDGIQLGETALPVLLLDLLRRRGALPAAEVPAFWPMAREAAGYIVRSGPTTQQDRWENERGHTPFTLGCVIASLLVVAELADEHGEPAMGGYLRETADAWNQAIESWLYLTGNDLAERLGIEGYYLRIVPPDLDDHSPPKHRRLALKKDAKNPDGVRFSEVVSVDALCLVRFGLRRHDDPRILNTLKAIDATLKVETPRGPCWHRYTGDAYGEHRDGRPFDGRDGHTHGRAWPLLTGERAHYELMAGRRDEADRLARAMAGLAGDSGMIPEQVWDADDIPEERLFKGRPSGSAAPLAWAHAEYLKLLRSIRDGAVFDLPPQTARRYLEEETTTDRVIWRVESPRTRIAAGEVIRAEVLAAATIRWSADRWATTREVATRDTGLGVHVADLDTGGLPAGTTVRMKFHWTEADKDEGKEFRVEVV